MERVYEERIKQWQAKFTLAIKQRDAYAQKFFNVARVPHAERKELIEDDNRDIEQLSAAEKKD